MTFEKLPETDQELVSLHLAQLLALGYKKDKERELREEWRNKACSPGGLAVLKAKGKMNGALAEIISGLPEEQRGDAEEIARQLRFVKLVKERNDTQRNWRRNR